MASDHTGCLRPCPTCGAEVLHAKRVEADSLLLERTSVSSGERYWSWGVWRRKTDGMYFLDVRESTSLGYPVHQCEAHFTEIPQIRPRNTGAG